ncbi:HPr or related phosphotransfer protein, partial [Dysosmobacter welbionis]
FFQRYPSRKNVAGARNRTCSVRPDYVTTRYGNDSSSLSQQADVIVVRLFAVLGHTLNVPYLGRHHLGFRQFRIGFGGHALIQRVMQPL